MGELKVMSKKIVGLKETFYNCFELSDGRYLLLLEKHAVVYDVDFTALSLHVYDRTIKLLISGKLTEELSRLKPICSYQEEASEDGDSGN